MGCRCARTSPTAPSRASAKQPAPSQRRKDDGDRGARGHRARKGSDGDRRADAGRRGRVRGDRGRRAPGRDHHGLEERQAKDAAGRPGAPGRRHPLRGARHERPPGPREGARVLPRGAQARAQGHHRGCRDVSRAAGRRGGPHRPSGHRSTALRKEPRRPRCAAVRRADAARCAGWVRCNRWRKERRPARRPHNPRVIARYTRPEIGAVWTAERRMQRWLEVELAATEAWAAEGVVPPDAASECKKRASFTVEAVNEREQTTGHDVAAFVDVVSSSIGDAGRWIHYGLTSSDVLDTALALQLRDAGEIVVPGARAYRDALIERALEHRETMTVGRTHGVHAEPTTFGLRLAGFAFEAERNLRRLERAFEGMRVGKLSGAVGTYASVPPRIEERVMDALGLRAEDVSTQVVPRDRHAELVGAIALAGAGLERFATEVRNLQRTEVREVEEPFGAGQKGSSAMPHKRNPILAERITGLARVLRGYAQTGLENVALWHERDISHSGAERVVLPDATILLDYMQHTAARIVEEMTVDAARMLANLELTHGALFSQRVLLALVERGMARDDAYRIVQEEAQRAWEGGTPLRELLAERDLGIDLDTVFDLSAYTRHAREIVGRLSAYATQRQVANSADS